MAEKKYIVTITRQFGSLGRPIAGKCQRYLESNIMTETSWKKHQRK